MKYIFFCVAALSVVTASSQTTSLASAEVQKETRTEVQAPDNTAMVDNPVAPTVEEPDFFAVTFAMSGVMQGHNTFASNVGANHYLGNGTLSFTLRPSSSTEINISPMWMYGDMAGSGAGIGGNPNALFSVSSPTPFLGTAYIRQNINLQEASEQGNEVHMTITAGKVVLPSLFESNAYANDPTSQYLNISALGFGAWELAQEARGTTWAVGMQVSQQHWSFSFAAGMLPDQAGGMYFDNHIGKAHSLTAQMAFDYAEGGRVRVLGFLNHANALDFKQATQLLLEQQGSEEPDLEAARSYQYKQGLGIEIEQHISENIGSFMRASWNDGRTESFTFTQINASLNGGVDLAGALWGMEDHHAGISFVYNALSTKHRHYHEAGGSGFMVSGGNMRYAAENIVEMYYRAGITDNLSLSLDYQFIANPGYDSNTQALHLLGTRFTLGL